VCPNFVDTFEVWCGPAPAEWAAAFEAGVNNYQFVRMELCNGGNLEDHLKTMPNQEPDVHLVAPILFQALFASLAAQTELHARHYDIKLLNYFLQVPEDGDAPYKLKYGLDDEIYEFQTNILVKLADYGTVICWESEKEEGAAPITTLENAAPEMLLKGAKHCGNKVDMYQVGLSLLHLLTGQAPYEELFPELRCPATLRRQLTAMWRDQSDQFGKLQDELEGCDSVKLAADTLWRSAVMFKGLWEPGDAAVLPEGWDMVAAQLDADASPVDCYSFLQGTNPHMVRARERASLIPGAEEMLRRLLCLDELERWDAATALKADMFHGLRVDVEEPSGVQGYMKYY